MVALKIWPPRSFACGNKGVAVSRLISPVVFFAACCRLMAQAPEIPEKFLRILDVEAAMQLKADADRADIEEAF